MGVPPFVFGSLVFYFSLGGTPFSSLTQIMIRYRQTYTFDKIAMTLENKTKM